MRKSLSRLEIKQAILTDHRFRELFPELEKDIQSVLGNPGCACNVPIFDKFFQFKQRLQKYFTNREIQDPQEEVKKFNQNHWTVINCKADMLEQKLNELHKAGRKYISLARWQDEITIVINDMGVVF